MRSLIFILMTLISTAVCAQSDSDSEDEVEIVKPSPEALILRGKSQSYFVEPKYFYLGYTVNLLKTGVPLGYLLTEEVDDTFADTPDQLKGAMQNAIRENEDNANSLRGQAHSKIKTLNERPSGSTGPQPTLAESDLNPPAEGFDECANSALRLLKQWIRLKASLEMKDFANGDEVTIRRSMDSISTQLQVGRAAKGVYCGKGWGELENVSLENEVEQIKLLTSLTVRSGLERDQIARASALAFNLDHDSELRETWKAIWNKLTLVAVFSKAPLPKFETVVDQMSEGSSESTAAYKGATKVPVQIRYFRQPVDHMTQFRRGLKILEEK